ncbi:hypothetical protein SLEP1_g57709 [Rubroshorea leprosula]|uniref:Uncharacterized protein n=1 Tax=Rubroshorea leprosula TaxID=152421 RepID=A0AAV5MNE8_9ROSI|nr:hypothetical protein SLEP1_g57709 [Rubroshorea leprosula]
MSSMLERHAREESNAEDDVPLVQWQTSSGTPSTQPVAARSFDVPPLPPRDGVEVESTITLTSGPRIAYPEGFSYTKPDCHAAMLQGMHNFIPPVD